MKSTDRIEAQYPLGTGNESNIQAVIPMMENYPISDEIIVNDSWENGKYGHGSAFWRKDSTDLTELKKSCSDSSYESVCSRKLMSHTMTLNST